MNTFAVAETMWEWVFTSEGVFLWPQTVLAALTITLSLSAIELTRRGVFMPRRFRRRLEKRIEEGGSRPAITTMAEENRSPLARVVEAGFRRLEEEDDLAAIEKEVEKASERVGISVERRLGWIASLAHVSMMTGLLGTVCGLTVSFMVISQKGEAPPPAELAHGVSQALCTTIIGLLTAIPALLVHGYLRSRASQILFDLEESALSIARRFRGATGDSASPARPQETNTEASDAPT